jgi:hypothetical protein
MWTWLIWLGVGRSDGLLWTGYWTLGFHKSGGNLLNGWATISLEDWPCSMELVSYNVEPAPTPQERLTTSILSVASTLQQWRELSRQVVASYLQGYVTCLFLYTKPCQYTWLPLYTLPSLPYVFVCKSILLFISYEQVLSHVSIQLFLLMRFLAVPLKRSKIYQEE